MDYLYLPENLDLESLLCEKGYKVSDTDLDRMTYFVNIIMSKRYYQMPSDYVPLDSKILRKIIRDHKFYANILGDIGVLECDGFYAKAKKCLGYRISKKYKSKIRKSKIKTKTLVSAMLRNKKTYKYTDLQKHLYKFLSRITISEKAYEEIETWQNIEDFNCAKSSIDKIIEKSFYLKEDSFGRIHTNITNLKRDLRKYLKFNDQSIVNLDISSSQPLLLYILSRSCNNGVYMGSISCCAATDLEHYKSLVEAGEIYPFLSEKLLLQPTEDIKHVLYRDVFFGKDTHPKFCELFPTVAATLKELKKSDYRNAAWTMQRLESDIVINKICRDLMDTHPNAFITTIHDSFISTRENIPIIQDAVRRTFRALGVAPKLRVEIY